MGRFLRSVSPTRDVTTAGPDTNNSSGVHLLGIRHHGPGSARSVLAALDQLQPSAVLVEAPADVQSALSWVGHPDLVAPVALLGWVAADPARAMFAPFASFSPEWQAISWANKRDVEVRAIDLPMAVSFATAGDVADELVADQAPRDPLAELAFAAGDPDPERWWEDVIEHRGDGAPAFSAIAEAMHAAREATLPSVAEQRREAHMRRAIRAALKDGHDTIAVVCGAWHVPALDVAEHRVGLDAATLRGLPKQKVAVAWVPWTHRRLTRATGYAAGVESPGWYRHVFESPGPDGVGRFFVEAAKVMRERAVLASPDHLIGATRLADSLAAMRGRPRPGLAEVLDAAESVIGGIDIVRDVLVIGDTVGSVPAKAPQVPLARDLDKAQRSARLRPATAPDVLEVDLRTPTGLRKSHLLHRLRALDVPWGTPIQGRGSSGTFRETWSLDWQPEFSIRLVERAALGATLESAATARLIERGTQAADVVALVAVLESALLAGLPNAIGVCVEHLARQASLDPDVGHLMDAVGPLAATLRYGDVRGTDAVAMRTVFDGLVVRIVAGVAPACRRLDSDAAAVMADRLTGVQAALSVLDHRARAAEFPQVLVDVAGHRQSHGLVQGRATRLLHDQGVWASTDVERRLAQALSPGTPPTDGAAFVEGFLAGSGTVLVHDTDLLGALDRWLSSLTPDAFESVLVLLRRTFGVFEAAERRQLMTLIAGGSVERHVGFSDDVDADRAARALITVRQLLGLPVDSAELAAASAVRRGVRGETVRR